MNIDYWYSFMETSRQKSISKASEKLQLTHPALSKQIRSLEQYYGVRLFSRSSTGVELTDAGLLLFEKLQSILQAHENLREEMHYIGTGTKKITIGALPSIALYYLPPSVMRLQEKGYQVDVTIRHTSRDLYELLQSRKIDVALMEQTILHKSMWTAELLREAYYAILPATHTLAAQNELQTTELADEPLVAYPDSCNIRKTVIKQFERLGVTPNIRKEIDYGESIHAYVMAGAGLAVTPLLSATQITDPRLKAIPLVNFHADRIIILTASSKQEGKQLLHYFKEANQFFL